MRVKYLSQEQNTLTPARLRTMTARSGIASLEYEILVGNRGVSTVKKAEKGREKRRAGSTWIADLNENSS